MVKNDVQLRQDVEGELEWDPSVHSQRIAVAVEDGIVTLTGEVESFAEKWHAERAVESVAGVRGVANELRVRVGFEYNDTNLAKAVVAMLDWNVSVPSDEVMVEVDSGRVTLSGSVAYDYQRRSAESCVRYLRGVQGIYNDITVKPQAEAKDIEKQIGGSFARRAALDAHRLTIEASGGEVILRGTVRSWPEREDAEKTAWGAPGVTSVVNHISVNESD